jgi:hypothetical protein
MNNRFITLPGVLALALSGCGQSEPQSGSDSAKVYRDSGAIQCESEGLTLGEMRQQLEDAGVQVLSASCGSDGVMRTTVCGAPAGHIGLFEVASDDLATAKALGFDSLETLPQAVETACRDDES